MKKNRLLCNQNILKPNKQKKKEVCIMCGWSYRCHEPECSETHESPSWGKGYQ